MDNGQHIRGSDTGSDLVSDSDPPLTVFFDGDCPVCRMEVRYYRRIDSEEAIAWSDITTLLEDELPDGKSREGLLGVFHARVPGNDWVTGVDAFAAIWSRLPVFRHFAWVFRAPVLRQAAQLFYRGFLAWQRRDRKRRRKALAQQHATSC